MSETGGKGPISRETGGQIDPRWEKAKRGEPVEIDEDPSHYDLHRERKAPKPKENTSSTSAAPTPDSALPGNPTSTKPWNEEMVRPIDKSGAYRKVNLDK